MNNKQNNNQSGDRSMAIVAGILLVLGIVSISSAGMYGFVGLVVLTSSAFLFWKSLFYDTFKNRKKVAEYEPKLAELEKKVAVMEANGFNDYIVAQDKLNDVAARHEALSVDMQELTEEYEKRKHEYVAACKQSDTAQKKLARLRELNAALVYMAEKYSDIPPESLRISGFSAVELDELAPSVTLGIHSMDSRDLLKAFKENDKAIDDLADSYRARYTTKTNQTIYDLMVIALRAELQNILYDLKYQKLDKGIDNVKEVTQKYLSIASGGNQQLTSTMVKFIGELEYLFTNAVKIEYKYYIRKEQARQEQLEIRERMRQEAEERKALELERKRVEAEEAKFKAQIEEMQTRIDHAPDSEVAALRARLLELESQLVSVVQKKDEIATLQNGKAGNVYIISNLGSFGDHVFKIGMTRRRDPQERIDELGDASVPFGFDVHSFIFSEDAVALETELHHRLESKRVNKVNSRKEFFDISIDELEALTHEISPTAEFRRTMAAEEYRQSLSAGIA